ncbi:hypothetical protein AHF37_10454 [Paragonimus kellicotti]|nr:hypothetical protein AHF37_10454 [Paragonimus kellicotti]
MDLFVELGTDCNACGSATWELEGHHVTFAVYGPDEAKAQDELTHRACVEVIVTSAVGQHTLKETELESYLITFMERLIDVKAFPRMKISGRLCIVTGEASHPKTVAASMNAISLALLQSGLPLRATIAAVCTSIEDTLFTIAVDVTHPKLSGCNRHANVPSIFSIFTGTASSINSDMPNTNSLLTNLLMPTDFSKTTDKSFYREALDLANVMVTQLASIV